jgi:hypothetical protein
MTSDKLGSRDCRVVSGCREGGGVNVLLSQNNRTTASTTDSKKARSSLGTSDKVGIRDCVVVSEWQVDVTTSTSDSSKARAAAWAA